MALKAKLEEAEGINMTPMLDVVLNLLVFFLLCSSFANAERRLDLELPTVKQAMPMVDMPEEITINVSAEGQIVVATTPLSLDQLTQVLEKARKNFPEQAVAIRGSKDVRYQKVAEVIALCKRVGIARLDVLVMEQ